jgi:hypothetical protein
MPILWPPWGRFFGLAVSRPVDVMQIAGAISQGGESLGWIEFAKRGRTRVFAYGPKGVVSLKSHRKLRGWPSFMSATTHSPEHFRVQYNLRWLRQWKVPSRECEQWVVPRR